MIVCSPRSPIGRAMSSCLPCSHRLRSIIDFCKTNVRKQLGGIFAQLFLLLRQGYYYYYYYYYYFY